MGSSSAPFRIRLLLAGHDARPDQPQDRRGNRRRQSRGALRTQPGLPSLGDRPRGSALPVAAGRRGGRVQREPGAALRRSAPRSRSLPRPARRLDRLLARNFHTSVNVIRELNDLPTGGLTVGMTYACRARSRSCPPRSCSPPRVSMARPLAAPCARAGGAARDSLWTIARRNGMNVNTLASLNGMHPGDALRAGQRIRLTSGSSGGRAGRRRTPAHVLHGARGRHRDADCATLPVQRPAAARLEWPELGSRSTPAEAAHPSAHAPQLKRSSDLRRRDFRHNPCREASAWDFSPANAPSSWASRLIAP